VKRRPKARPLLHRQARALLRVKSVNVTAVADEIAIGRMAKTKTRKASNPVATVASAVRTRLRAAKVKARARGVVHRAVMVGVRNVDATETGIATAIVAARVRANGLPPIIAEVRLIPIRRSRSLPRSRRSSRAVRIDALWRQALRIGAT